MYELGFVVEGILLCIIGILGIIGNVAAIIVFARQKVQKNFHAFMISLSVFDLIFIMAAILLFTIPQFSYNYTGIEPFILKFLVVAQ
jgi:hypothetical protein